MNFQIITARLANSKI